LKTKTNENNNDKANENNKLLLKQVKKLHIIIKADFNGSLEAILNVLETYESNDKVILDLVHFEVGQIKKSDLELAETFDAIIYSFNLPPLINENNKIKIKSFNVIYKLFDDLKLELNELAPLVEQEEVKGEAKIQKIFKYDQTNKTTIDVAGSICTEGLIDKNSNFRIERGTQRIADNLKCKSLKHIKTSVNTVKRNVEFGISFDQDPSLVLESGDKIICYDLKMVKSMIDWNLGF
jgi:translation initiation factor IF-2